MRKIVSILLGMTMFTGMLQLTLAVTTVPYTVSYSARLTNSSGAAVTTAQDIRFSIWSGADFTPGDLLPSGAIDPAAAGFTGWEETHSVTPDSNGLFQVRLGSITTLPNFNSSTDVNLQVDVKPAGSPLTSFEVLDPDGNTANTTDRFPLDSAAFAINADTLDNHDAGSNPGEIPFLDGLGLLPISTIPGGSNTETFILDFNNTIAGPGSIKLQFGNTLNKFLEYDNTLGYFNFNDNVNITGDLTTTGTINGVTISPGTVGPYDQSIVYEPVYSDSVIQGDGSNNNGTLESVFQDLDGAPGNNNINQYKWTSLQTSLEDMDLVLRVNIPEGFTGFQSTPIEFTYRTDTASVVDNQVDLSLEDTAGNPVTLTGASALVSTTFTTTSITYSGSPTFTAGQPITIKIKLTAKNTGAALAGKLKINYTGR